MNLVLKQVHGLKEALASERSEKARLDMARENLQADMAAMRANLQQLSRELAYHRSAPDVAHSGQLNQQEVGCGPKPPDQSGCLHVHISIATSPSKGSPLIEEKLASMCTRSSPDEKKRVQSRACQALACLRQL